MSAKLPRQKISWPRIPRKKREAIRRLRRMEALLAGAPVYLDDYEAAEFLDVPIRTFRRFVEQGMFKFQPGTELFDINDLHQLRFLAASDDEERRFVTLRRVRWEAQELEMYSLPLRLEMIDDFVKVWNHLAKKFERDGMKEEAAGVRAIVKQAQKRLQEETIAN